jgi:hypothetical protein
MPKTPITLLFGLTIAIAACSDSVTNPSVATPDASPAFDGGVDLPSTDASCASCHAAVGEPASGGAAGGHSQINRPGFIAGTTTTETVSFIALSTVSSLTSPFAAKGQLQAKNVRHGAGPFEVHLHARIDCLRISGTIAWVSGPLTRWTINGQELPVEGVQVLYKVRDNGWGSWGSPPDEASSILTSGVPGPICATSDVPIFESVEGNIWVRQFYR